MAPADKTLQQHQVSTPGTIRAGGSRILLIVLIVLLCFTGAGLLLWPYNGDTPLPALYQQAEAIDGQLQGLKALLQDYKSKHGHYPTNQEGLAALDNFEGRLTLTYSREQHVFEGSGFRVVNWGVWWGTNQINLQKYCTKCGRLPQTEQEFFTAVVGPDWQASEDLTWGRPPTTVEIGVDKHRNIFLLDRSGVLCPWSLPYLYENRVGCPRSSFQGSFADGDRWGYSVKVDDGVYISSSGGYLNARELNQVWWGRYGPRFAGGFLIFLGVALRFYGLARMRRDTRTWAIVGVIAGLCFGVYLQGRDHPRYGHWWRSFERRTCEMASLEVELLEKYRAQGLITEETFRRAAAVSQWEWLDGDVPL